MASASSPSSSNYSNSPCAACKFLRRKCLSNCIFSPCFPPEEPQKFANVHKIFGASNVSKLLNEILPHQREDAVNSLAYEAEARMKDPVYGCVGAISVLQRQLVRLQKELDVTNAQLMHYTSSSSNNNNNRTSSLVVPPHVAAAAGQVTNVNSAMGGRRVMSHVNNTMGMNNGGSFGHNNSHLGFAYNNYQWNFSQLESGGDDKNDNIGSMQG